MSDSAVSIRRTTFSRTLALLRPYRSQVVIASLLVITWTATVLAGPLLIRYGIDEGIRKNDRGALNLAIFIYIGVAAFGYVIYRVQVFLIGTVGENFLRDLRLRTFEHIQRLSMPFYDREQAGVVVSRMTSDIDSLQDLVQTGFLLFVSNALLLVFSILVLTVVSWQLMLVCLISVPFVAAASIRFARRSRVVFLTIRDRIGSTLSQLQEGISGIRVIQAFGRQDHEVARFANENRKLYEAHLAGGRIAAFYIPVIEFAGIGTTALVVGIGGWWVGEGVVTVGTVTFFVLTLSNLFEPMQQLSQLFTMVQSAGAGLRKVYELLDTPIDLAEAPDAEDLPERGELEVCDLSFGYNPDDLVLNDVNLRLAQGERFALVGPTGAGKSTLAKLMARLYDPTDGAVTFAGIDLRMATQATLRKRIVVVPQEGFLFNASIRDNVRIADATATDEAVDQAMDAIGALDRFAGLPEGLDTEVNERGSRLSAGERQLISLARASLADPAVLVLDEATSSLDPGTEALVEAALEELMRGRTTIVIAHRLSTAERSDRVGVVTAGRLLEVGTHDELVAQEGAYAALYAIWTGAAR